ncbi:MAG: insulinase family protein [bacterium]|nr:insulinase family protein [bacterium]
MRLRVFTGILALALMGSAAFAGDLPVVEFEKYTLENGLQVILHEDHTTPTVSVNVWYHVGSKNEKPGRTGFAHLFEHMMFQGSTNHDTDYFLPLQKIGAVVNGSTNKDRTNYWENVPADQVELALWLEADRMGYLLPAMTQEKLDNQKDVVKNEKREGENAPYAKSDELELQLLFPKGHPYSWTVIGSMDDLSRASKEDVGEFFELYYAPNNASLSVAGDIDPELIKPMIAKYFGTIPPGLPVDRVATWIPRLDGERRSTAEDKVELPRLYMTWHTPGYYKPGDAEFDLLGDVLSTGKNSRLYKALVYEQQIAQDVGAFQASRELSSTFTIQVTAAPGYGLDEVEAAVDAELARLLDRGIRKDEFELAQTRYEANFVRGLQRVGGFGGKADRLNRYNVFTGDPGYLEQDLARYLDATPKSVLAVAREYMGFDNRSVVHIVPQGTLVAGETPVDRADQPASSGDVLFAPPAIQTATLANGLDVYLVEKRELPLTEVRLAVSSGWSADPADKPGTAAVTADLLDEGAAGMDALELSEREESLGAQLGTGGFFDASFVTLNVLTSRLDEGLELMAKVALEPDFNEADLDRIRRNYLGRQQQEASTPMVQAIKELQQRVFPAGHPYAQPYTGTGTPESLEQLTTGDLRAFHATWYKPNNAAVVVVGDLTLNEAVARLEKAFGDWQAAGLPTIDVPATDDYSGPKIVVIDRPGAQQSTIVGGCVSLPRRHADFEAFQTMNEAFGGQFAARINMNLREDKGYTYGVRSQLAAFRDAGIFLFTAPVHTQYTKESLQELIKEMDEARSTRPITDTETTDARNRRVMGFPQQFETFGGVAGGLVNLVGNGLALDSWLTFQDRINGLDGDDLNRVVRDHLDPDHVVWIVVGDWSVVEPGLRELDLGEIEVIRAGQG